MSKKAMKLEKIIEQAQVFASAWSLVGGRFDSGNMLDEAEAAKKELRQMVAEALAPQPAQRKPLTDEQLNVAWHDRWTNPSLPNTPYGCFVGGIRLAEAAHNIKEQP